MIIKLIPENEAEKAKTPEFELSGVKEFFIIGNQTDEDGTQTDFHEWNGSYRYLFGSLAYYSEILNDERREAITRRSIMDSVSPQLKVLPADAEVVGDEEGDSTPFVSEDDSSSNKKK